MDHPPTTRPKSPAAWRPVLLAILALAGAARFAQIREYSRENPLAEEPWQDGAIYWAWADRISGGQLIEPTPFHSAPLYPYLLGLVRVAGGGLDAVVWLQLVTHLLTIGLIASATRIRAGPAAGLLAAAIFALLSEPASFVLRVLPNSLQLLLIAGLWRAVAPISGSLRDASASPARCSLRRALTIGTLLGLLTLAMPQALLAIPLVAVFVFVAGRRAAADAPSRAEPLPASRSGWFAAATMVVVAGVVISPATLHNAHASGEFIPVTAHSGITMRQGNSPVSHGIYTRIAGVSASRERMHEDAARVFREVTGRDGSWGEVDRFFRRQAIDVLARDPIGGAVLLSKKAWWLLTGRNYDDQHPVVLEVELGLANRAVLSPLATPWVLGAAGIGLAAALRRRGRRGAEWVFVLLAVATVLIFFYTPRYRLALLPIACGMAAYAVTALRSMPLGPVAATAIVLSPLASEQVNRHVLRIDDRVRVPVPFDSPALMRDDFLRMMSGAMTRSGDRRTRSGATDAAAARYERALELWKENGAAAARLGAVHYERGDAAAAIPMLERALVFDPTHAPTHLRLYNLLIERGREDIAVEHLARSVDLAPENADSLAALAWLRATNRNPLYRNFIAAELLADRAIAAAGARAQAEPIFFDARGAAAAMADKFEEAQRWGEKALRIAERDGDTTLAAAIRERLHEYAAGRSHEGPAIRVRVSIRHEVAAGEAVSAGRHPPAP